MMPGPAKAALYWRTARHLRPIQIFGRVRFRLARPKVRAEPAPPLRSSEGVWSAPAARWASLVAPRTFRFLNVTADLDAEGWHSPRQEKLWLYNLHYFDDLNAVDAAERAAWHRALATDWIAANPPGAGDGWEPYPTSLRIVNWIKWALRGENLSPVALHSLAIQTRWLMQRLEHHLLGNHLFVNAKALVFAGLFFAGEEADVWLERGLSILRREVREQILPDGGQFELSPMYHALALEDLLDLVNAARRYPDALNGSRAARVEEWRQRIAPMQAWLASLTHPDGEIAFFNDATMGVAPSPAELDAYARRLGFTPPPPAAPPVILHPSGYARLEAGPAVLIADIGPVGPDYLPGHAHADTLSFELSLGGRRFVVNSGVSRYGLGPERLRQRGTAAHSTLTLDGGDSSEVWGSFRVGRRARIVTSRVDRTGSSLELEATHDGYRNLAGRPLHERRWSLAASGLTVIDRVAGGGMHEAVVRFHFGPDLEVLQRPDGGFRVVDAGGVERALISVDPEARAVVESSSWHPEFGLCIPTRQLAIRRAGPAPFSLKTVMTWRPE